MLTWTTDSILFHFVSEIKIQDLNGLATSPFEDLSVSKKNDDVIELVYTWLDPVRVRDKILSREQRSVSCWVFKSEKFICAFSNSESSIAYFMSKLSTIIPTQFERVFPYDYWKQFYYCKNLNWFAKLTSIHIEKKPTSHDPNEIKKISIKNITEFELESLFENNSVTNLTFHMEGNTIFYIDKNSVVSFPDTAIENDVFYTLSALIKEMSRKYA